MATQKNSKLQSYLATQYTDFDIDHPTARLSSLYSDFSKLALLNQYGYDANVAYWRSIMLDCNLHGLLGCADHRLAFDGSEIANMFIRPGLGKPLSLDCVVEAMIKEGELQSLQDYIETYTPSRASWLSWMFHTIQGSLWRPWKWLPGTRRQPKLLVVLPTVITIAKHILASHHREPPRGSMDHLLTFAEFRTRYGTYLDVELTDGDLWLILRYLSSEMGVAVADHVKGYGAFYVTIKFPEKNELESTVAQITQQDRAVISIRTTCQALRIQVDDLQNKAEELTKASKEHYTQQRKQQALYALKRKKHIVEILDRRLKSLETMETMLMKIEASQSDLQVVQAFNMGADALRAILDKDDLSIAMVDEAMLKVQHAFEDQKEVEDAIAQGVEDANNSQLPADLDDDQLEKELVELERQQQEQAAQKASPPQQVPHRQQTMSAPPAALSDAHHESELARLDRIFASLQKAQSPPSKKPTSEQRATSYVGLGLEPAT